MSKIRVIEYLHGLGDGGAETLVKDYALLIDRDLFDISIVVTRKYKKTANLVRLEESGIPIHTIYPCWNVFTKLWHETIGRWWYVPYKLHRILKREQAQVLHIHLDMLKYVQKIGEGLNGIRLFYTCHSVPRRTFCKKRRAEIRAAERLLHDNNLQMVALHREMADELDNMFGIKNTIVIKNGIDFSRFRNIGVSRDEKRMELGIPQDAFVIGHVGRFNAVKNHMFLVDVFREIAAVNSKAFLLMIGAGDKRSVEKKLQKYGLQDRCLILSHRIDVNEILKSMDVFVFPSICEGLGIAMIEAQVSGLKCVASDTVPMEAFKTEKAIALPLGDPKHWAEVILDENAKGIPHGSLDDYDMNKEIKRLEKLYLGELNE